MKMKIGGKIIIALLTFAFFSINIIVARAYYMPAKKTGLLSWIFTQSKNNTNKKEKEGEKLKRILEEIRDTTKESRKASPEEEEDASEMPISYMGRNFVISGPKYLLERYDLLKIAEKFRTEFKKEWSTNFDKQEKELRGRRDGKRTLVDIQIVPEDDPAPEDEGATLLTGPGSRFRGDYRISIATTEDRIVSTLLHEITHVAFAQLTYPNPTPQWLREGVAGYYDDRERQIMSEEVLLLLKERQTLPSLNEILYMQKIAPSDRVAYAVSKTLVEFFLKRGDKQKLLSFGIEGAKNGWEAALRKYYDISNVGELQREWEKEIKDR